MFALLTVRSINASSSFIFFFNDTATTEIYTLSLHDALPICIADHARKADPDGRAAQVRGIADQRSEEHTSELQSHSDLVCRLLLEKKNTHRVISVVYSGWETMRGPLQYRHHRRHRQTVRKI